MTATVIPLPTTARRRRRPRPPDVTVRELGDGELDVLDAVFAGLSPRSRALRFHGATPRLTPGVRRALAAVDGHTHLAVAAFAPDGTPIGIARLVGLDAHHAELAVEVVDAWQGRGVGRRLLLAVATRGRAAGYDRLVADVLTENTGMRVLLASVLPVVDVVTNGPETTLTASLRAAETTTAA
ncbi:GNAT family N-acetyltransferase [Actinomycetospora sp. TBRC 11914]|uniref:GNAT family N-acetyltransferase n=1 Tax=Actinomycetospora sp. TBRC 11914 TaxID=2729387 RepID=UPI00145C760F|nr:GNAT family N-acetyltransferase [Actinomycetospora sp. TBRC 11914]NMO92707.1 GNAT family N-acetyltransferase [Actinomycetospora sp. TBRC 11914]